MNASSAYGKVTGAGWYDENSTATMFAQPPILYQPPKVFARWEDGIPYVQPRIVLLADSPKAFTAVWKSWDDSNRSQQLSPRALAFSLVLFLALLAWNLQLRAKRMRFGSDLTEQ